MKFSWDSLSTGLVLGILLPLLFMCVYWQVNFPFWDFSGFLVKLTQGKVLVKLVSLFAVANMGLFFFFIWRYMHFSARGVLISTFIYAAVVAWLKIIE
jgi:hypothetical protein